MSPPAVALLSRALGGAADVPTDPMSERILDAALALAAASGLRHVTMDDVARRARVGRMTVYRRFGDKASLVDALVAREAGRCLAELDAATRADRPIADQVAEGFVVSLRIAREHPLLNRLARIEPESLLASFRADGGAVFALARAYLAGRLREAQKAGVLGPVAVEEAAEVMVRLAVSFVLIQDTVLPVDDDDGARAVARRLIAPVLGSSDPPKT